MGNTKLDDNGQVLFLHLPGLQTTSTSNATLKLLSALTCSMTDMNLRVGVCGTPCGLNVRVKISLGDICEIGVRVRESFAGARFKHRDMKALHYGARAGPV